MCHVFCLCCIVLQGSSAAVHKKIDEQGCHARPQHFCAILPLVLQGQTKRFKALIPSDLTLY
eukprot:scaffold106681_cov19-Tisochrysis_lutea.AAC.1